MNELSQFLYFAEIIPNISGFLGAVSTFVLAGLSLYCLICKIEEISPDWKILLWAGIPSFLILSLAVITPSKQTIYMMVASEAGEAALETEEGEELLRRVKELLNKKESL